MSQFFIRNKNFILSIAGIAAFAILLFLFSQTLNSSLQSSLKGPLKVTRALRRTAGALFFFYRNYSENERLKKELDLLRGKAVIYKELSSENARLRSLLGLKQALKYNFIAARVIARDADNWSKLALLDKGKRDGIKKGSGVITYLGIAGFISEVSRSTAKLTLLNSPGFAVSALVERSRQEGLICGTLGNDLIMRYLKDDADVREGDIVITSGLSQRFPKGLLIGVVSGIQKAFSGLSRYAIVRPSVNLSDIEEALIIIR